MISCIIIEDEPLAIDKLEGFVARVPFLILKGGFNNPMDGMHFLKENHVDLVLLDIQMEQLSGIQLLESLNEKPYIIITSAYAQYALKGYELSVFDYLLKPFSFERFLSAVNRVYDDMKKKQPDNPLKENIFLKTEYRLENIKIAEILFVEGMREYLRIHLPDRKIMTKMSFQGLLQELPDDLFIQTHKSWVVSLPKIESIEHNRIKIKDKLIPIGEKYKDNFWRRLGK